jgi:tyrosyl-tRNA synthetase
LFKKGGLPVEIEKQVSVFMHGAEFGDPQIGEMMARELEERLKEAQREGRPLQVYCGYDVTAPDIHLGHTITMRKLRRFQEFGHDVTFLIGTFTTLIGDPSDRDQARSMSLPEQIMQNAQTYAAQAFKILDPQRTAVRFNHEWLSQLTFADIIKMASCFTVQQFLTRDRLHNRLAKNEPLWLREFLYPLAQGYDAVALKADVQIGGTEQLFNLMAARKVQEVFGQKPQVCLTFALLAGTDGKVKMSKSLGNYIGINEPPEQQYGKVMSLPDSAVMHYFNLATRWLPDQVKALEADIQEGRLHPMEAKKKLAREIVDIFHGSQAADIAAADFRQAHQSGGFPEDMPEYAFKEATNILDLLVETGLCASKSKARRAVQQSSVKIDGKTVTGVDEIVRPGKSVLQRGRRNFVRLRGE